MQYSSASSVNLNSNVNITDNLSVTNSEDKKPDQEKFVNNLNDLKRKFQKLKVNFNFFVN